ncbi:hypothetical protein PVAND_017053 [Polypedilum vanderplanki]|uniref:Odorant binding protein n=1 Tax=Polypedilum vanderplanki TaxID=319348 RepID=A0A9J6BI93_POLVA|nr:hypothetical protein PVAND_017053 [Polypedilum vanderplanki]
MKKFLVIFAAFLVCCHGISIQEQKQMMVGAAQECKNEVGATDNELSLLILKKPMVTKEGKCLVACIMKSMGIVEDQKMNEQNFIDFVSVAAKNDAGIIKKMREIASKCENIKDPDECEMAVMAIACIKKGITENKIKIDIGV